MIIIKELDDYSQVMQQRVLIFLFYMMFSKSFGYALRGVLYVALMKNKKEKVQLDEIALQLGAPRYFLGKVMKNLVKENILGSLKGPYGGFYLTEKTLSTTLFRLMEATGEVEEFSNCVLHFKKCNPKNPCPMHHQIESLKIKWQDLLSSTSIGDLLNKEQPDFLHSIASI